MIEENGKPVDLVSKVHKDGFSMSMFALLDVFLIALMLAFLSSKFVLAPGFPIDLSEAPALPSVAAKSMSGALVDDDVSVLNVLGRDMIFFDGKIYKEDAFVRKMQTYKANGSTLLVKTDASVSSQTILHICSVAKAAGFERVQLAAIPALEQ